MSLKKFHKDWCITYVFSYYCRMQTKCKPPCVRFYTAVVCATPNTNHILLMRSRGGQSSLRSSQAMDWNTHPNIDLILHSPNWEDARFFFPWPVPIPLCQSRQNRLCWERFQSMFNCCTARMYFGYFRGHWKFIGRSPCQWNRCLSTNLPWTLP